MKEIRLASWSEFQRIADYLDMGQPNVTAYAFRGQNDESWGLQPTLLRHLLCLGLTATQAVDLEKQALSEFKAQAHHHIQPNLFSATNDTISWWTLMQHHGAPTRLLDWTSSIYIAAYFAVTGNTSGDGAIWAVHTATVNNKMAEKHINTELPKTEALIRELFLNPEAPSVLMFTTRLSKSDRMITQQGCFSVCQNIMADHGHVMTDIITDNSNQTLFCKIIIPSNCKGVFLGKLRTMNISANSLFPGLDGLARSITELVQLGSQ